MPLDDCDYPYRLDLPPFDDEDEGEFEGDSSDK